VKFPTAEDQWKEVTKLMERNCIMDWVKSMVVKFPAKQDLICKSTLP
jgi:hypothetical protein